MKGTVNGKSLDQVLSELKAPFPEEELKKNEKNETYIPVESLESRLNSVIGVLNYDTLVTYEGIQEVLGRFVVVAKTILIIYDDERNALIRKSALGGSNIIVVKDTGKPSSLKTDIAAAQSESFKNVCKLLQIGISQIRSGKQRRGQNGTKQRREEKNLYKIRFTSSAFKMDILSMVLDTDALTNFQFGNSCRIFLTQFSLPPTIVIRFVAIAFFISEIGIFTVGEASSVLL